MLSRLTSGGAEPELEMERDGKGRRQNPRKGAVRLPRPRRARPPGRPPGRRTRRARRARERDVGLPAPSVKATTGLGHDCVVADDGLAPSRPRTTGDGTDARLPASVGAPPRDYYACYAPPKDLYIAFEGDAAACALVKARHSGLIVRRVDPTSMLRGVVAEGDALVTVNEVSAAATTPGSAPPSRTQQRGLPAAQACFARVSTGAKWNLPNLLPCMLFRWRRKLHLLSCLNLKIGKKKQPRRVHTAVRLSGANPDQGGDSLSYYSGYY